MLDLKSIIFGMGITVIGSLAIVSALNEESEVLKENAVLIDSSVKAMNLNIKQQLQLLDKDPIIVYINNEINIFNLEKLENDRISFIPETEAYINEVAEQLKSEIIVNEEFTQEELDLEFEKRVLEYNGSF